MRGRTIPAFVCYDSSLLYGTEKYYMSSIILKGILLQD